jgi:hypothetical protein
VEESALNALALALTSPGGSAATYTGPVLKQVPGADQEPLPGQSAQGPPPGSEELRAFGTELGKALATRGFTAQDVARRLAVPEPRIRGWLDGADLPPEPEARALDEVLTARGAIMKLARELRTSPDQPMPGLAGEAAGTLGEVFRRVANALRATLTRASDGAPLGWPQDLRQLPATLPVTVVSTAYGLKTLVLLEGHLAPDLLPVLENLRARALQGGYLTAAEASPRPEATASVIDTLHRVDGSEDFATQIAMMLAGLTDFEKSRPFILATVLETSLRLRGAEELTELLAESLLAARRPYGNRLLWPEKSEALLIDPAPSVAHTARAVRVLAELERIAPDERLRDAVEQGVSWLLERQHFHFRNAIDAVERLVDDRLESVYTRHFTAALVVKALVSAGIPATHPTVSSALTRVWESYAGDTAALWKWDNGDLPIWMTFDAVDALRLASLAVPARPGRG